MICDFDPFPELPQQLPWRISINAPFARLEKQVEVLFGNTVDAVLVIGEQFRMIDVDMMEVREVEGVLTCPGVRIDDAVRQGSCGA